MSQPTKRFAWYDRDTAARDMLQLVYHAPRYISRTALRLLEAFHSDAILPDMEAMLADESQDIGWRCDALHAIAAAPGDLFRPHFIVYVAFCLKNRAPGNYLHRLLDGMLEFADKHPSNREWFFEEIACAEIPAKLDFLRASSGRYMSTTMHEEIVQRLLNLLDQHPQWLNFSVVETLVDSDNPLIRVWLEQHFEQVTDLYLKEPFNRYMLHQAYHWERLRLALTSGSPEFARTYAGYPEQMEAQNIKQAASLARYQKSSAWLFLSGLYERAADGDKAAYDKLAKLARPWKHYIPFAAAATHFIAKLIPQHNTVDYLCSLLQRRGRTWQHYDPVRYEAGDALGNVVSPAIWEIMVNTFFIGGDEELSYFLVDWIAYQTNRLSGIDREYTHFGNRPWFRALADITEEQLQQEINR